MKQDFKQTYYAHGKLLLTAEYLVLYGAKAIALPLQYGQRMEVARGRQDGLLQWNAFSQEELWFRCELELPSFKLITSSDPEKAVILQDIFRAILQLNPAFSPGSSLEIETRTGFNRQWGLGSSSTLIANLARWAHVDAFKLNELIFHGSGFDIACATASGPVSYRKNQLPEPVSLNYPFLDHLYFIYSGSKKSTRSEISRFLHEGAITWNEVEQISQLSDHIAQEQELIGFQKLIAEHEKLLSSLLGIPAIKSARFNDFEGEMKSLGAWGGDFYLAATRLKRSDVLQYFKNKGLNVVFSWKELVLDKQ
ncbi:GYDIA family GHMP kinase [Gaoshiqia sp. Z1-71]|uniref:GYDIA family GHMP kinase n=1 Tax=Gaoshiqia hydrogeniformans TaxID=3290090 RepID=UPI003BF7A36C